MSDRSKRKPNWALIIAIMAIVAAVSAAIVGLLKKRKRTTRAEVIKP